MFIHNTGTGFQNWATALCHFIFFRKNEMVGWLCFRMTMMIFLILNDVFLADMVHNYKPKCVLMVESALN